MESKIKELSIKWCVSPSAAVDIWNAAIEAAAESAKLEHHPVTGNICLDQQSILDLKMEVR